MIYVIFRMFSDIFLNTVYAADEAENYNEILISFNCLRNLGADEMLLLKESKPKESARFRSFLNLDATIRGSGVGDFGLSSQDEDLMQVGEIDKRLLLGVAEFVE